MLSIECSVTELETKEVAEDSGAEICSRVLEQILKRLELDYGRIQDQEALLHPTSSQNRVMFVFSILFYKEFGYPHPHVT